MLRSATALVALLTVVPLVGAHAEDPDCGLPYDAGDNHGSASLRLLTVACDGQLHNTFDSTDFYKFSCSAGQGVEATVQSTGDSVNLRAYLPVPVQTALAADYTGDDQFASIRFTCSAPGYYRIQLLNGANVAGIFHIPYYLTIRYL